MLSRVRGRRAAYGYELIGQIRVPETIARGPSVKQRRRLHRQFGKGEWRKLNGLARVRYPDGKIRWTELHWFRHMVSAKEKSKSKQSSKQPQRPSRTRNRFALCVKGTGFDTVVGRAYRILEDRKATRMGCIRVVDESGEDYLYPASWFVRIRIESRSERRVTAALKTSAPAA